MLSVKSRVSCIFQVGFSNQKTIFLDILYFLCLLCSLRDYLFQCRVSSVYRVYHKLIVRVRHYMGIFRLIEYVLGIVQVYRIGKDLKISIFLSVFLFLVRFSLSNSFLQSSGFRYKSRSMLLW